MRETASFEAQQQPQRVRRFNVSRKSAFSVFSFLFVTAEMLTTYFHIETLLQVEAHFPPSFVPAILHDSFLQRNKQLSCCPFSATRDSQTDVIFRATDCERALQPQHLIQKSALDTLKYLEFLKSACLRGCIISAGIIYL